MLRLKSVIVISFFSFIKCEDYIELNDEEYYRLPKLFSLDDYDKCMSEPHGIYCMGSFALLSKGNDQLYQTLQGLSIKTDQNFNHTKLHKGICVTSKYSSPYLQTQIPETNFQNIVNETIFNEYGLEAVLEDLKYCKRTTDVRNLDLYDNIFLALLVLLIVANFACSCYYAYSRRKGVKANPWLLTFSIQENWNRLTMENAADSKKFASINGVKCMAMFLVILSHIGLAPLLGYIENTRFIEMFPTKPETVIMINGALIIQLFFLIGAFLLTYNMLIFFNNNQYKSFTFWKFPQGMLMRIFRISPTYMWMVFFLSTLAVFMGDGPLWNMLVEKERESCRSKWWIQMLFLQNTWKSDVKCLEQCWYLAADMQLYMIGLFLMMIFWKKPQYAKTVLPILFIASVAMQFIIAYNFQLKPFVMLQTPELLRTIYKGNASWKLLYSSSIGNLPGYLIGMALGYIFFHIEKHSIPIHKNKWFVLAHHLSVPMAFLVILSGRLLLLKPYSLWKASLYASFDKAMFAFFAAVLMLGNFVGVKSPYRYVCEWDVFRVPGRLTLCALLIHSSVLRTVYGSRRQTVYVTVADSMLEWAGCIVLTFVFSVPVALLIEYPFIQIHKLIFSNKHKSNAQSNTRKDSRNLVKAQVGK